MNSYRIMIKTFLKYFLGLGFFLLGFAFQSGAQTDIDYLTPKTYEIGGITVTGAVHLDENAIRLISELSVGSKIDVPGDAISKAIRKLWDQNLFSEVGIDASRIMGDKIFLDIN